MFSVKLANAVTSLVSCFPVFYEFPEQPQASADTSVGLYI